MGDNSFTLFVGIVIISICIGTINSAVYGWLTFGSGLFILALLNALLTKNKGNNNEN
jgi:hypothetical protein